MDYYTDIHSHLLSGVDDGAVDDSEMFSMLDMAYRTGTRRLCITPHFNPEIWGDNTREFDETFARLSEYAAEKYPDMSLYAGNEICYSQSSINHLNQGKCRTLNGGKHVLVDFHLGESFYEIRSALLELLRCGYVPVFAHVEWYDCINSIPEQLYELSRMGIIIQLSAIALTGRRSDAARKRALKILKAGLADVVASDAHNTTARPPCLDGAEAILTKLCGKYYTELLLKTNPDKILGL